MELSIEEFNSTTGSFEEVSVMASSDLFPAVQESSIEQINGNAAWLYLFIIHRVIFLNSLLLSFPPVSYGVIDQ
jgi:hypothetical protein